MTHRGPDVVATGEMARVDQRPWSDVTLSVILTLGLGLGAALGWSVEDVEAFARSLGGGWGGVVLGVWAFATAWSAHTLKVSRLIRGAFEFVRLVIPVLFLAAAGAALARAAQGNESSVSSEEVGVLTTIGAVVACFVVIRTRAVRRRFSAKFAAQVAALAGR